MRASRGGSLDCNSRPGNGLQPAGCSPPSCQGQAAAARRQGAMRGGAQKMPARIIRVPAAATAADRAAAAACWLSTARTPSLHTPSSSCRAGVGMEWWGECGRSGQGGGKRGAGAHAAWAPGSAGLTHCTQPASTSPQAQASHRLRDAVCRDAGALHVACQRHGPLVLLGAVAGGNQGVEDLQGWEWRVRVGWSEAS